MRAGRGLIRRKENLSYIRVQPVEVQSRRSECRAGVRRQIPGNQSERRGGIGYDQFVCSRRSAVALPEIEVTGGVNSVEVK